MTCETKVLSILDGIVRLAYRTIKPGVVGEWQECELRVGECFVLEL